MKIQIPVYQPSLAVNERKYVLECLDSNWISSKGKFVGQFESDFSSFLGISHAATVCNGTAAIHLALLALGIGPGDEVIVPTFTYIASVNAITYTGAKPVFVDSIRDTWQMDVNDISRKITSATRAIMCVHLYGHACEMEPIIQIAHTHSLFIVEDCAEAFGTKYGGRYVGTFGDISAFSFFGNKTITTGEGGMTVTNDDTLHERLLHFRGQGLAKHREYWHDIIGYNYRMTNVCAAIGLAQLEHANEYIKKKRVLAEWYSERLEDLPVEIHNERPNVFHTYWMFSILTDEPTTRENLRNHLREHGIETRPTFHPVHTMPMYAQKFQRFPVAEYLGWRGINLPSWPDLTVDQVDFICSKIRDFYGAK